MRPVRRGTRQDKQRDQGAGTHVRRTQPDAHPDTRPVTATAAQAVPPVSQDDVVPGSGFSGVNLAIFAEKCPGRTIQVDFGEGPFDGNEQPQPRLIWLTPVRGGHALPEDEPIMGQQAFRGVVITSTMGAARGFVPPLDQTVDLEVRVGTWFHWGTWGSSDTNVLSITVL